MIRPSRFEAPAATTGPARELTKEGTVAVKGRKEFDKPINRICKCGCGEEFQATGRAQKYKSGHKKHKPSSAGTVERICRCGCGEKIDAGAPAQARYKMGHSKKGPNTLPEGILKHGCKKPDFPSGPDDRPGIDADTKMLALRVSGSLVRSISKAIVLDMLIAVGTVSKEKAEDMIAFVNARGWNREGAKNAR
jgi:hypothetical protein